MPQQCRISIAAPGMASSVHDLTFDTLIGSSHLCDIVLPRSANSPDRHSLLVPAGGHWYLYDLLGRVGRRNGKDWRTRVELEGGDRIEAKGVVIEVLSVSVPTSSRLLPTASSTTDPRPVRRASSAGPSSLPVRPRHRQNPSGAAPRP